jgi:hypothetical protein
MLLDDSMFVMAPVTQQGRARVQSGPDPVELCSAAPRQC